jgi:hypothetical protein
VGRHRGGDLEQLLEPVDPEAFVDHHVAVIALRGAVVGAQKVEFDRVERGAVLPFPALDRDGVALEAHPAHLLHPLDDIGAEDVGLGARGREEDLVLAGFERDEQPLARKIPRRPDLARLDDHPRAQMRGREPGLLMAEQARLHVGAQGGDHVGGDQVFGLLLLRIGGARALAARRVEIGLVALLARELADPRKGHELAAQQVDLLEVAAGLLLLGEQGLIAHPQAFLGAGARAGGVPALALLPARQGRDRQGQFFGDLRERPAPPIERAGLDPLGDLRGDGKRCLRGGEASMGATLWPLAPQVGGAAL